MSKCDNVAWDSKMYYIKPSCSIYFLSIIHPPQKRMQVCVSKLESPYRQLVCVKQIEEKTASTVSDRLQRNFV